MVTQSTEATAILRRRDVQARVGLSRSALYQSVAAGTFPPPIKLGNSRSVGWVSTEVDSWVAAQIRASRKAAA